MDTERVPPFPFSNPLLTPPSVSTSESIRQDVQRAGESGYATVASALAVLAFSGEGTPMA